VGPEVAEDEGGPATQVYMNRLVVLRHADRRREQQKRGAEKQDARGSDSHIANSNLE
jgi:hypothetical protein